jgi:hypothetical protein
MKTVNKMTQAELAAYVQSHLRIGSPASGGAKLILM